MVLVLVALEGLHSDGETWYVVAEATEACECHR